MNSYHQQIESIITSKSGGAVIFASDFKALAKNEVVRLILSRLTKAGSIKRIAHGIYYKPKIDPILGETMPGVEEIVRLIAEKDHVRIREAGATALNNLGLTTQVPTKMVYITDGPPRTLKIGKVTVKFKATTQKKLATKGHISALVIQGLEELDIDRIPQDTQQKITELLQQEDTETLIHDLSIAPTRVSDFIIRILKPEQHGRLVEFVGRAKTTNII